jgi:hypothetical protein
VDLTGIYSETADGLHNIITSSLDGSVLANTNARDRQSVQTFKLDGKATWRKSFKKSRVGLSVTGSVQVSQNDLDGWRVDTLSTSTTRVNLNNTGNGHDRKYAGIVDLKIPLALQFWSIDISQQVVQQDVKSRRLSTDLFTGHIDPVTSHDYTLDYLTSTSKFNLGYSNFAKQEGFAMLKAEASWSSSRQQRDEKIPASYHFPRVFNMLTGTFYTLYKFSQFQSLDFAIARASSPVSLEDLRDVIDNRNPLMLTAGNPDLDMPATTVIGLNGQFMTQDGKSLAVQLTYTRTSDLIINKTLFFARDTVLAAHGNYLAPAGARLSTKENASGDWNNRVYLAYSFRSKALKSSVRLGLTVNHGETPVYVQENKAKLKRAGATLSAALNTSFSTKLETGLSSWSSLTYTDNGTNTNRVFYQSLSGTIRAIITGKKFTIEAKPSWGYDNSSSGLERDNFFLDVSIGKKFGKDGGFSINLDGFDLFNSSQPVGVEMNDDYIVTSRQILLRRCVMLRAEYKF